MSCNNITNSGNNSNIVTNYGIEDNNINNNARNNSNITTTQSYKSTSNITNSGDNVNNITYNINNTNYVMNRETSKSTNKKPAVAVHPMDESMVCSNTDTEVENTDSSISDLDLHQIAYDISIKYHGSEDVKQMCHYTSEDEDLASTMEEPYDGIFQ